MSGSLSEGKLQELLPEEKNGGDGAWENATEREREAESLDLRSNQKATERCREQMMRK